MRIMLPNSFVPAAACLLVPLSLFGQLSSRVLTTTEKLPWPKSVAEVSTANKVPKQKVDNFINSLTKASEQELITIGDFRFAPLEKDRIYLVAASRTRCCADLHVISPEGAKFRYTELLSVAPGVLATQVVDLDGDGLDEIIKADYIGGYQGASTDMIYWYSVFKWHDGVAEDVSTSPNYHLFYEVVVLSPLAYLERWFELIAHQHDDPDAVRFQLAEIEAVRLKYRRKIMGEKKAGLDEGVAWVESGNPKLLDLGIEALVEIPDPKADEALRRLAASSKPGVARIAQYALQRKAQQGQSRP